MKRAFLVVAIVIIGAAKANAADAAIPLYCEWKAPVGVEVGQSYLLELMFDSKLIRSTQFVNGVSKKPATFAVRTLSDVSVAGWSADSTGRIKEGLTINRLNGEAVFTICSTAPNETKFGMIVSSVSEASLMTRLCCRRES